MCVAARSELYYVLYSVVSLLTCHPQGIRPQQSSHYHFLHCVIAACEERERVDNPLRIKSVTTPSIVLVVCGGCQDSGVGQDLPCPALVTPVTTGQHFPCPNLMPADTFHEQLHSSPPPPTPPALQIICFLLSKDHTLSKDFRLVICRAGQSGRRFLEKSYF